MKRIVLAIVIAVVLASMPSNVKATAATAVQQILAPPNCSVLHQANAAKRMIIDCEISPAADGYVDNLIPSKAFAGSGVLIVQNVPSVPVSITDAFLKFDLSTTLPLELIQSMAKPENATLAMYVRLMNFFYNSTVEVHTASPGNWTENSLTWNTMPNFDANNYASISIMRNGTWARWDISRVIQPAFNSSGELALVALSSQTSWRNLIWFDSLEYPFSNGTTTPTLDVTFTEPYLTIRTPYPHTPVLVGEYALKTDANGVVQTMLPWGIYRVSVPMNIPIADGTRASFVDWSDGSNSSSREIAVGNNTTLTANYGIQHDVTANSPYGSVTGEGWYFENTDATITVTPTAISVPGVTGWLGARFVFDHWTGACTNALPQCTLLVDSPKLVTAVWRVDWSLTLIGIASLILLSGTVLVISRRFKHHRGPGSQRRTRKRAHVTRRRALNKK